MNVTILAKCDRCRKQFVFDSPSDKASIPSSSRLYYEFKDNQKLMRKSYAETIRIEKEYGRPEFVEGEPVTFCKECDAEYWMNFHKAGDLLESYWDFQGPKEV